MRKALAQVRLAAASTASVLVVGPAGSGRRHVASAIHYGRDPQHCGALVHVDGSAVDTDTVHSTLENVARRLTRREDEIDTLLLLELDRWPADAQAVVAEQLARPPRGVRWLATAGQSLTVLASQGSCRADLAGELTTLVIELPPLAARREDLPDLAQLLLEEVNADGGKQLGGFTPAALDVLLVHDWPGNIDELAGAIRQAHEHAAGPLVRPEDLPRRLRLAASAAAEVPREGAPLVLDDVLAQVEEHLLRQALKRAKGNKAKAASLLGISRPRLLRRIEQLHISDEPPRPRR
jgi:DNA-binding NtrC family response regulator